MILLPIKCESSSAPSAPSRSDIGQGDKTNHDLTDDEQAKRISVVGSGKNSFSQTKGEETDVTDAGETQARTAPVSQQQHVPVRTGTVHTISGIRAPGGIFNSASTHAAAPSSIVEEEKLEPSFIVHSWWPKQRPNNDFV